MKRFWVLWIFVIALGQDVHAASSRNFDVTGFTKLSIGSGFQIEVKKGSYYQLLATGEQAHLDELEAKVSNGKLYVMYKKNAARNNHRGVSLRIVMPDLTGVDFSGAVKADVNGFAGKGRMDIDISGASNVVMDFRAEEVVLDLSGASSLVLSGKTEALTADISGASALKGNTFEARYVELDASGASRAAVSALERLSADASGASSIRYSGSAREVKVNTSGAGTVKRTD